MPTVTQTIKFRNQRRNKEHNSPWMRISLGFGILVCFLGVFVCILGLWFYSNLTQGLPSVETLPTLLEPPNGLLMQPTRLFDRTKAHVILTLENPAVTGKEYLAVGTEGEIEQDQFSQNLIDATITAFDPGFWRHPGYSIAGISDGSHPTLAQRMVSDLVLIDEPASIQRNIRERILAAQITSTFGRKKILEWYLNSAQYGDLIFGADAAAHAYFGKSASALDLAEATMLTAISKAPAINPYSDSQVHKQQQELIIISMYSNGLLTYSDANQAIVEELNFLAEPEIKLIAPAFTDFVLEQLGSQINLERIQRGGFDIVTTLDYELQLQARCASETQITRITGDQENQTTVDGSICNAAKLLPNLQLSPENLLEYVHANVVVLDPKTGQILTLVGDETSEADLQYQVEHPTGTILSPFLYLTAFSRGLSPATLLWDIPDSSRINDAGTNQNNLIQDMTSSFQGPVRARMALVNDYLTATADVLQQVKANNVLLTEKQFGINTPEFQLAPTTTIGDLNSRKISLLEVVTAFATLANQGIMAGQVNENDTFDKNQESLLPLSILKVVGVDGKVWLDWSESQTRPIVSPQLAYILTHVLSDEDARRPSLGHPNPLEIGRPAAAKVSVDDNASSWAVGYIPQIAIGVWMGDLEGAFGGISWEIPAGLWHAMMKYASKQMPVQNFEKPSGISLVQVCDPSGLLVSELCPKIVQEVFIEGNEPTQVDNLYQKFYINRESELLATIFTPPEMLEGEIYLVVPPQAEAWARDAGLLVPPDTYDVVYAGQPSSPDVKISSPKPFDHIRGDVKITGSASGPGFSYYRLQVGQGLFPQEWIQIGEDVNKPVENGLLGTWETYGLEGLFVVQLVVVRQDQRVEHDILQVTIDNTKPEVDILNPDDDETITFQLGESMIIQVNAVDNLVLERVEFLMDGELQRTLMQPPFIILWPERLGHHFLSVRAYDLAGNSSESALSFSVEK